ncbi:hypothetical protein [Bradymonas sediminis]|uniref:Uncharacterized protein n=1 Tax=Bradymonas sediminis TaxID=1548548 RepID=A0A2Z4FKQ1_9DELT|nr:hypothetical protein [Bradymonas sediminis]AWV89284.1 hypothetical protein DN745_08015 [Bradymonas sediminis]TDP73457.1 hypothetical protein DFR33_10697 [Bradymonas sediminis]
MRRFSLALALCGGLCLSGCSDDPNATPTPDAGVDAGDKPDTSTPTPTWVDYAIGSGEVGITPRLAVSPSGEVGVAYYASNPFEGELCETVGSGDPPVELFWTLYYSHAGLSAADASDWQREEVADILSIAEPNGLAFAFSPDSTAHISSISGEALEMPSYCGANDVGLFRRNAAQDWALETAVATSGEAATGEPASDYGEVVGYWPALAFDSNGAPFIAYKDVHAGGLQGDDRKRADLELAHRNGAWSARAVDIGQGAGDYNSIAVDAQDRPIIAYYNPVESADSGESKLGIWVTRPDANDEFEKVRLFNQATSRGLSLRIHPDDDLARVIFYNSREGYPQLFTQVSETEFGSLSNGWEKRDIGDARFDEGYDLSLAINPRGNLAAAYYRCAKVVAGLGNCASADDALIFAYEDAGEWTQEIVDEGAEGLCGRNPSLAFDADGQAHIAYECEELVDGKLQTQLKYARRKAL